MSRKMLVVAIYVVTGIFATAATAQTPGTWTATGSMNTARDLFTATLLTNGNVLVAGGYNGTYLASAELYDPSTGIWTATGSMTTPRFGHTATLLPSGKVLVTGGQDSSGAATSSTELFDPNSGSWTPTGSMNTPRADPVSTLITGGPLSGMVLVAGGSSACNNCFPVLDSAELYDPSLGVWSFTSSMTIARLWDYPSPTTLPDGSILIVGGIEFLPTHWFNRAETYDPVTQTWTSTNRKHTTANQATVLLPDGKVLVAGGVTGTQDNSVNVATAELFDSSIGTWTPTASMSIDRTGHTLTLLASGQVLVAAGSSGGWSNFNCLTSAELYDSSAGAWFLTGSLTTARFEHTATLLPNGEVLAAGGNPCQGNPILSSAELYTPPPVATLSTTSLTFGVQLIRTRSAAQAATLTNTGTTTLTISSIAVSGDFVEKDNCGTSVPGGASCTINVAFKPNAKGVRTGKVTITDDAVNSPQTITLTGTGTVVQFSSGSLDFGNQPVGTTSQPQTVTVTNVSNTAVHISGIGITGVNFGDFLVENTTCGSSLPGGASCAISVAFSPKATGSRQASLAVVDNGGGSPQRVALAGTGT